MKLIAPAALNDRLHERAGQLEQLTNALAHGVGIWRARLARHRVAIAAIGGGIAGVAFATRWQSLARLTTTVVGAAVRATALSMLARARVERAVRNESVRASRTNSP